MNYLKRGNINSLYGHSGYVCYCIYTSDVHLITAETSKSVVWHVVGDVSAA